MFSVDNLKIVSSSLPMPRTARVQYEGTRYHIINRGNYRKDLFLTHKTDEAFTEVIFEACERYQWYLHAYVLMSNHYHMCLETPQANLSDGMRSYHRRMKLIMEEDRFEREKLFKDLSRGWYIGSKEGKNHLRTQIEQGTAKANVDAKSQLESTRIEKLLKSCLKQLGNVNSSTWDIRPR